MLTRNSSLYSARARLASSPARISAGNTSERDARTMGEAFVRVLLSPLRDAAIVDGALRDGRLRECPRATFRAIVRARDRAVDRGRRLEDDVRERPEVLSEALEGDDATDGARRAVRAMSAVSGKLKELTASSSGSERGGDGRYASGKYAVGGTLKGTSTREDDLKVRFWNLWGGSKTCREVMVKSARDSVYRNPEGLERAVLSLDRVAPFVDSPLLLHRAPELLAMPTGEIVRRLVKMRDVIPRDVGFVATQMPALLLMKPETLTLAARRLAAAQGTSKACVVDFVQSEGIDAFAAFACEGESEEVEPVTVA